MLREQIGEPARAKDVSILTRSEDRVLRDGESIRSSMVSVSILTRSEDRVLTERALLDAWYDEVSILTRSEDRVLRFGDLGI